eukprot:2490330-Rhodomonas_salina.4
MLLGFGQQYGVPPNRAAIAVPLLFSIKTLCLLLRSASCILCYCWAKKSNMKPVQACTLSVESMLEAVEKGGHSELGGLVDEEALVHELLSTLQPHLPAHGAASVSLLVCITH